MSGVVGANLNGWRDVPNQRQQKDDEEMKYFGCTGNISPLRKVEISVDIRIWGFDVSFVVVMGQDSC